MIRTIAVKPIGSRKTMAFVDNWLPSGEHDAERSGLREIDLPLYPPSRGGELRDERERLRLGLREATTILGWSAVELCDVERGSRVPEDWDAVFGALRSAPCPECHCPRGHKMDCSRAGAGGGR